MTGQGDNLDDTTPEGEDIDDTTSEGEDHVDSEKERLLAKYKVDPENFSEDDLIKTLKRIDKAEHLTVSQKKLLKKLESEAWGKWEYITKADLALEKFLDKNPELEEYRDDVAKYVNKGNTLEEAKILVLNSDKSIENRKKLENMNITDGEEWSGSNEYTQEQLANMNPEQAQKIWALARKWKVTVK